MIHRFRFANFLILTTVSVILAIKPLEDVDIGWHLAAGLSMIRNASLPSVDFLSAGDSTWICYSWLPELFWGVVYQLGGFTALQILQIILIVVSSYSLLFVAQSVRGDGEAGARTGAMSEILSVLVGLNFLAPFFHLRPQLLSVVCFAIAIILAEKRMLQLRWFAPLLIVWANVHVFWPFGVLVFVVYDWLNPERGWFGLIARSATLACCGMLSPNGYHNLAILWQYAFEHEEATRLIDEFQTLTPAQGYVFYLFLIASGSVLVGRLWRIRKEDFPALLLFLLVGALAIWQRKYLSMFAVCFVCLACRRSLSERLRGHELFASLKWALCSLLAIFGISLITHLSPVHRRYQELFQIPKKLRAIVPAPQSPTVVLNTFDDGGWLGLALWLSADSAFRTSIDGRTLVMGATRLREYETLIQLKDGWCNILEHWNPRLAVLPAGSQLARQLSAAVRAGNCQGAWIASERVGSRVILSKKSPSGPLAQ